jgi:hypothetical protein
MSSSRPKTKSSIAKALTIALAASTLGRSRAANNSTATLNQLLLRTTPSYNAKSLVTTTRSNVIRNAAKNLSNNNRRTLARKPNVRYTINTKKKSPMGILNRLGIYKRRKNVANYGNAPAKAVVASFQKAQNANKNLVLKANAAGVQKFNEEWKEATIQLNKDFDTIIEKYFPLIRSGDPDVNGLIQSFQPHLTNTTRKFANTRDVILYLNNPDIKRHLVPETLEFFGQMKGNLEQLMRGAEPTIDRIEKAAVRAVEQHVKDSLKITGDMLLFSNDEIAFLMAKTDGTLERSDLWRFLGVGPLNGSMYYFIISMTLAYLAGVIGQERVALFQKLLTQATVLAMGAYGSREFYVVVSFIGVIGGLAQHPSVKRARASIANNRRIKTLNQYTVLALKRKVPTFVKANLWKPVLDMVFGERAMLMKKHELQTKKHLELERIIGEMELKAAKVARNIEELKDEEMTPEIRKSLKNLRNQGEKINRNKLNVTQRRNALKASIKRLSKNIPTKAIMSRTDKSLRSFFVIAVAYVCWNYTVHPLRDPKKWIDYMLAYGRLLGFEAP